MPDWRFFTSARPAVPRLGKVNAAVELIIATAPGLTKSAARVVSEKDLPEKL